MATPYVSRAAALVLAVALATTVAIVKIKRWGSVIDSVKTAADGTYRVRILDRAGRYVAAVAKQELTDAVCAASSSSRVRHRH